MSQKSLVSTVADKAGISQQEADVALKAVFDAISDHLTSGDAVKVAGFGGFEISERAARKGRNPATGEEIDIAAAKVVKFKPAKGLKDAVNA